MLVMIFRRRWNRFVLCFRANLPQGGFRMGSLWQLAQADNYTSVSLTKATLSGPLSVSPRR